MTMLHNLRRRQTIVARADACSVHADNVANALPCVGDAEVVQRACKELGSDESDFVVVHLAQLRQCIEDGELLDAEAAAAEAEAEAEAANEQACEAEAGGVATAKTKTTSSKALALLDARLRRLHEAATTNTVLVLCSGTDAVGDVKRRQSRQVECMLAGSGWTGADDAALKAAIEQTQSGVLYLTVKQ